jgi:hypothetical protein
MAMKRSHKCACVLLGASVIAWLGWAKFQSARKLTWRQEIHIVNLLKFGIEHHVHKYGRRPHNWSELQAESQWSLIETICRNYRVEHPTNLYVFLPKPILLPGYQPREVWMIRKLPLNYDGRRHGRWAIGLSNEFPIRFWLEESELPPALVEQLPPQ